MVKTAVSLITVSLAFLFGGTANSGISCCEWIFCVQQFDVCVLNLIVCTDFECCVF
jgi:hypothetical protein